MEKTCTACLVTKATADFYSHPNTADGLLKICKECHKKAVIINRLKNVERYREYDKQRSKLPHRIENAIEWTKKWRKEDSRRMKCHNAVARALKSGEIEPTACFVCGADETVAHHPSYDLPLDVVWLCQAHHAQTHVAHRIKLKDCNDQMGAPLPARKSAEVQKVGAKPGDDS